ncbi:outer membrane beta-barrel family protein [Chitinophaga rhizophila]|uniref:TonB-dependent receptor n=1 Tax=Chitinophaga rhizophila TaxID=2866212 RepID=A0ABS7G8B2_9BACT|nr:outer membrane beta-barrel family protein [Chitinophaga rhizophila]MBW8683024.1 TonB-dependent receptor [Chitinophaga rhizophila]
MFRKILCILLLICSGQQLFAQVSIKGRVKDLQQQPVPFATVRLVPVSDTLKGQMALTDTAGMFTFTGVSRNKYKVIVHSSIYESVTATVVVDNATAQLEDIVMSKEKTVTLSGVSVRGTAPVITQKLDRLVVNVKGTPIGVAGNALQVMERLPGIEISPDGSSIKLNGKDHVGILLNGKLTRVPISSLLLMLSSTNAKDIDRIELITTPPAQYDAEFTGGLINIQQVVSTTAGSNGSILLGIGYGWRDKAKAGFNWNVRRSKTNFYGGINYDRNNNPRKFDYRSYNASDSDPYSNFTVTDRYPVITGVTGRIGLDYDINKRLSLGLLANGNLNLFKQHVSGSTEGSERIGLVNNEDSRRRLYILNAHVGYKISKSQVFNLDVDYLNYYSFAPNEYVNTYYKTNADSVVTFTVTKRTPVNVWTGKADYITSLTPDIELVTGSKLTFSRLKNNVVAEDVFSTGAEPVDSLSERSTLAENIAAAYASVSWTFNQRTRMNVGLRYEYSSQDLVTKSGKSTSNRSLSQFFPSLFFSRVLNKNNTLQFAYSRRIARPTYTDLAPFVSFIDPNTFYIGNINLRPALSNTVTGSYLFRRFIFTAELTREKNAIAKTQAVFLDSKQQMLTSLNIPVLWTSSLSASIPVTVAPWWNMQYNIQLSHINQQYEGNTTSNTFYFIKTTQNFKLDKNWMLQIYGSYNSEKMYGTTRIDAFQRMDVSITREVKKWHSSFQLSINDLLNKYYRFQSINHPARYYKQFDEYEPRVVRLTFTHDFGNLQIKKESKRETSSEEIRNRF